MTEFQLHNATDFDSSDLEGGTASMRGERSLMVTLSPADGYDGSVSFEASPDGGATWFAMQGEAVSQFGVYSSTVAMSNGTTVVYALSVPAYLDFRVRMSGGTQGSLTAVATTTKMRGLNQPPVVVPGETFSLSALEVDPDFSYAGLPAGSQLYYDLMWDAINDANETPNPDTLATFVPGMYTGVPETSYEYAIGYALRSVLFAYYFAFAESGEKALLTETRRIMALVTPANIENLSTLYESMLDCAIALHMVVLYANRNDDPDGATYLSEFNTWFGVLQGRLALHGGVIFGSLAHGRISGMFTNFCLYMVTGDESYLAAAQAIRTTFQGEIADLSHDNRLIWYHRMPRSASATEWQPQPTNYADYTIQALLMLDEMGFHWYYGATGFSQQNLVNTLLNMTAGGTTCTGDIDGGDDHDGDPLITSDVWAIRSLGIVAKYDDTGVLASRSAAISALAVYPYRRPAWSACLLYAAPDISIPEVPTITSPTEAQVVDDSTPDIVASSPAGTTKWKFRIASDSGMTTIVASVDDHGSNTWTVSPALSYAATLYVQAAAGNGAGYSSWSTAVSFKQSYRLKVLSYSPTEAWRLNETSGTTITALLDSAKNGTLSGITLNARNFLDGGASPNFNGSGNYVNLLTSALQSSWSGTQGTVFVWFYDTNPTASGFRFVLSIGDGDYARIATVYNSNGHFGRMLYPNERQASAASRVTDQWRSFGISWNVTGNVCRMVCDGTSLTVSASTFSGSGSLVHAYLGRRVDGRYWMGGLAWMMYWNTEQSLATLQALSSVPT